MKNMVWDEDKGEFVEEEPFITMTLTTEDGTVVAQASGETFEYVKHQIDYILTQVEPHARKDRLQQISSLLRALIHKVAANRWKGSSDPEWVPTYIRQVMGEQRPDERDDSRAFRAHASRLAVKDYLTRR